MRLKFNYEVLIAQLEKEIIIDDKFDFNSEIQILRNPTPVKFYFNKVTIAYYPIIHWYYNDVTMQNKVDIIEQQIVKLIGNDRYSKNDIKNIILELYPIFKQYNDNQKNLTTTTIKDCIDEIKALTLDL